LHGLYDVFVDSPIAILVAAMSIVLFMAYLIHGQDEADPPPFPEEV